MPGGLAPYRSEQRRLRGTQGTVFAHKCLGVKHRVTEPLSSFGGRGGGDGWSAAHHDAAELGVARSCWGNQGACGRAGGFGWRTGGGWDGCRAERIMCVCSGDIGGEQVLMDGRWVGERVT